jgi:hypothetical protein
VHYTSDLWHGLKVTGINISRSPLNSQNVFILVVYVDTIGSITFPVFHALNRKTLYEYNVPASDQLDRVLHGLSVLHAVCSAWCAFTSTTD